MCPFIKVIQKNVKQLNNVIEIPQKGCRTVKEIFSKCKVYTVCVCVCVITINRTLRSGKDIFEKLSSLHICR